MSDYYRPAESLWSDTPLGRLAANAAAPNAPAVSAAAAAVQQVQREHRGAGSVCGVQVSRVSDHWRRARRTDPATSHEAAAGVDEFEGDHVAQILEALAIGPAGATAIASRCGLGRDAVGKRMSELERRGLVVVDGKERNANGRNEARYRRSTNGDSNS